MGLRNSKRCEGRMEHVVEEKDLPVNIVQDLREGN